MIEDKKIEISVNNLTKLLISECRYGYTRNNHLMPSCAYNDAEKYLQEIVQVDEDAAIRCAKQLCEECISDELACKFYDGLDTECNNMKEAIDFVDFLLNFIEEKGVNWKPYNYSTYTDIINIRDGKKFNLYKITDFDIEISDLEQKGKLIYKDMTDIDINKKIWVKKNQVPKEAAKKHQNKKKK